MELAIAEVVFGKLSALMVEKTSQEIALVRNFTRDLKWLKQLTSIHDFLAEANSRPVEHELVKTWLHRVWKVAWDAEDILEQYALHTSNNVTLSCVCDFLFRYKMAKRIQKMKKRIKSITEDGEQLKLLCDIARSLSKHQSSSGARKENCLLLGDSLEPVEIESKVGELIKVIESSHASVVVVAGIAGVGKTLLLETSIIRSKKGMITQSGFPYHSHILLKRRDLMSQIKGNTNNVSEGTAAEDIRRCLCNY